MGRWQCLTGRGRSPLQEELTEVSTLGAYFEMLRQVVTESGTRIGEVGNRTRLQVKINQAINPSLSYLKNISLVPPPAHKYNRKKHLTQSRGGGFYY